MTLQVASVTAMPTTANGVAAHQVTYRGPAGAYWEITLQPAGEAIAPIRIAYGWGSNPASPFVTDALYAPLTTIGSGQLTPLVLAEACTLTINFYDNTSSLIATASQTVGG